MANIDNLNFKVIIDDKDFNAKIDKMEKAAKEFNVSMSRLLDVSKASQQWSQKDIDNNRRAWQAKVDESRAQEKINREKIKSEGLQRKINAQIDKGTKGYNQQSRILNDMKNIALGYLSIQGAGQLLSSLVRVTGEFELQKTTLAAMLGDLDKAEQIITKIQGLAVESPFQFKELTTYAKQLSAFSVPAQELYDTTKMLADVSAGLGVGMDRIVLAYGQVRSAAFLRGQEVRQFTEAGIPILNELAKQFSELEGRVVSTNEVFDKISKRLVPFEMVAKVFKDMTSEGGKFYNMQEVQAETLKGKISNLKDAYEVMLNEIGKGQSENLKGAVDWARRLMQNYEETGRTLVELVVAYGIYKTALLGLTLATGTFSLANHKLLTALNGIGTWVMKNPYALIAAGLATIGYTIYKDVTALESYEKIQKSIADTQSDFNKAVVTETAKLDTLYAKLNLAKEGTEAYNEAKKEIYTKYASYISELRNEGIAVDNLATIYENLKTKVEDSQKARFRAVASQNIEEVYGTETSKLLGKAEKATERLLKKTAFQLDAMEKQAIQAYVGGVLTMGEIESDERIKSVANILNNAAESGNDEWMQFGHTIEWAREQFAKSTSAYKDGLSAIEAVYGKAQDATSDGLNPFVYGLFEGEPKGKSPAQKAIEEQIKSVQKLQDAYEKLIPYLNEVQMKSTLKSLFPNISEGVIDSLDFRAELERLADELAKFDEDAAQRLKDTVGKDVAGTIADSFKAVEQYKKMLDSWLGEDFSLSGEGVSFDISKIIHNLNNEYAKIDEKREKALDLLNKAQMGDEVALAKVREVLGEEAWQKYLVNGSRVIDELAAREKRAAKQTADEKIRDLASKDLKERMEKANVNLTDFDDKTIQQIRQQIERLKRIRTDLYNERNKIYEGGVTEEEIPLLDRLDAELKQLGIIIEDTGEEVDKKLLDNLDNASQAVGELGGSISSLGEAMGSSGIAEFGRELEEASNLISGISEAMKAEDTVALIANIVSYAISSVTDVITAAYERQRALNDAAREYAEIMMDIRRESYSGIFGTDEMGLAAENAKILKEAQEAYQKAVAAADEVGLKRLNRGNAGWEFKKTSVMGILGEISKNGGWELYAENGEINLKAIEAYFDSYKDGLTKKQRGLVEDLIEQGNLLDDAARQQAEYLTSLFSGVADNIADGMIEAFLESGDAAMDMGSVISDVSKQMVADLIKNIYLMPILDNYKKEFEAINDNTALAPTERTEQQLAVLDNALQQISGQSDNITATIERFEEYLRAGKGEEGTTDLGQGIKGITEDQANLLASYLNAIRADVAYSKTLWVRMDANLQRIADMFTSSPTLMEYQAQIAANTYNTAMTTQQILAELRSVVTTDSGDTAIRVYS